LKILQSFILICARHKKPQIKQTCDVDALIERVFFFSDADLTFGVFVQNLKIQKILEYLVPNFPEFTQNHVFVNCFFLVLVK
jgi:hypothetical protein